MHFFLHHPPQDLHPASSISPPGGATPPQAAEAGGERLTGVGGRAEQYPQAVEALRRLGGLGPRQDALEGRVAQLEQSKADHAQLQQLSDMLSDVGTKSSSLPSWACPALSLSLQGGTPKLPTRVCSDRAH